MKSLFILLILNSFFFSCKTTAPTERTKNDRSNDKNNVVTIGKINSEKINDKNNNTNPIPVTVSNSHQKNFIVLEEIQSGIFFGVATDQKHLNQFTFILNDKKSTVKSKDFTHVGDFVFKKISSGFFYRADINTFELYSLGINSTKFRYLNNMVFKNKRDNSFFIITATNTNKTIQEPGLNFLDDLVFENTAGFFLNISAPNYKLTTFSIPNKPKIKDKVKNSSFIFHNNLVFEDLSSGQFYIASDKDNVLLPFTVDKKKVKSSRFKYWDNLIFEDLGSGYFYTASPSTRNLLAIYTPSSFSTKNKINSSSFKYRKNLVFESHTTSQFFQLRSNKNELTTFVFVDSSKKSVVKATNFNLH